MKFEEYSQKLKDLQVKHDLERNTLMIDYAMANKTASIGDILALSDTTMKVDRITTQVSSGVPGAVFHGPMLKKDLTPRKDGQRYAVWQSQLDSGMAVILTPKSAGK